MDLPDYGLDIHMSIADTYTPIIVNQYIVGSDGSVTPVPDTGEFTVAVEKYASSNDTDAYRQKFFTTSFPPNYSTLMGENSNFVSSYTVDSPSDTRWMLTESVCTGAYIKPTPKEGYMLSGVTAVPLNRDGTALDIDTYGANNAKTLSYSSYFDSSANKMCYRFYQDSGSYSDCYSRSQQMQVNVYYAEESTLTVYQHTASQTDQSDSSNKLETITVSAYESPENSATSNVFIKNGRCTQHRKTQFTHSL